VAARGGAWQLRSARAQDGLVDRQPPILNLCLLYFQHSFVFLLFSKKSLLRLKCSVKSLHETQLSGLNQYIYILFFFFLKGGLNPILSLGTGTEHLNWKRRP
jgi:hypothetical protein